MAAAKKSATRTAPKKTATKTAAWKAAEPAWAEAPPVAPAMAYPAYSAAVSQDDKTMALLAHLLGIFTSFVGPLVIWLVKKDQSPFAERHAREALNFQITVILAYFVSAILVIILIGILLLVAVGIVSLIFGILATIAASQGRDYTYPMSLRLVKGPGGQ